MATTKQRINISVSKNTHDALMGLAKRDQEPLATKAAVLLELAIEIEEDSYFEALAAKREKMRGKWISHEDAWK